LAPRFDAIRLGSAAYDLSRSYASAGEVSKQSAALEVRRHIVTRALGHCPDRVGAAMLDSARCGLELGEAEKSGSLCEAVIEDFSTFLDDWECEDDLLLEEEEIALQHLIDAIDLLLEIRGGEADEIGELRRRCLKLKSLCDE